MINRSPDEWQSIFFIVTEHVVEMVLEPERVVKFNISSDLEGGRLAGIVNEIWVIRKPDGARLRPDLSDEGIPQLEAFVLCIRIRTDVGLLEGQWTQARREDFHDLRIEPSILPSVKRRVGPRAVKVFAPTVQQMIKRFIEFFIRNKS